ncbi:MAG: thiol:disulfide interchange protein DsbA/DsbL [Betaproteobacteria bacterium]|nr:thiol:disulfide interchange protein DsbA/DsbL [Betaproteobacteria bacterium]
MNSGFFRLPSLLLAALFLVALPVQALSEKDYSKLNVPQTAGDPGKIEVIEFFSYACSHCNDLNPALVKWKEKLPVDVVFRKVPVSFNRPQWAGLSKLYYALEATGNADKFDAAVFAAIHRDRENLFSESGIQAWLGKQSGMDGKKVFDAWRSFGVQTWVKRADEMTVGARIPGVPALVVDGKYLAGGASNEEMLHIVDELIEKARSERKPAK